MNPEIKAAWIAALESGEYPKTRGLLQDATGFCCLGVLCDLHSKATGTQWGIKDIGGGETRLIYIDSDAIIPDLVSGWSGLRGSCTLISLNDTNDTFGPVIEYIGENT